ncbi:MAG: TIGR03905 family TSCPD domain-containing protein [Butyrivibrio sp.]
MYSYKTQGTCSQEILFDIEGDIIKSVEFIGGCSGNTQGVARLVEGMKVEDAIARMEGIRCGARPTSCPDQLAKAFKKYLASQN